MLVRENRTLFLDGGCEVQGNLIIYIYFKATMLSYFKVGFRRR